MAMLCIPKALDHLTTLRLEGGAPLITNRGMLMLESLRQLRNVYIQLAFQLTHAVSMLCMGIHTS